MSKEIFVAASYSSQVDYGTGEVFPEYKGWLEDILDNLETHGHKVFCALRADQYKINNADPATAYMLDKKHIKQADALLALLDIKISSGVQTEIGLAIGLGKQVILAHKPEDELTWFNKALVRSGEASETYLPLDYSDLPFK